MQLEELRSQRWFAASNIRGFAHRQRTQQKGIRRDNFLRHAGDRITNTWSDLSPCHAQLRERAEAVKRGVWLDYGCSWVAIGSDMGLMTGRAQEWHGKLEGTAPAAAQKPQGAY